MPEKVDLKGSSILETIIDEYTVGISDDDLFLHLGLSEKSDISKMCTAMKYTSFKNLIKDYVENYLFKPVAEKKGFFTINQYGYKNYIYPSIIYK
jgi:hypothetical protein